MSILPELTSDQIKLYDDIIDNDTAIADEYKNDPTVREVIRAGLYLAHQLDNMKCPHETILRIQYTAGQMSFGNDPWQVVSELLESYTNGTLEFEPSDDPNKIN
jgi:hypothetical protein